MQQVEMEPWQLQQHWEQHQEKFIHQQQEPRHQDGLETLGLLEKFHHQQQGELWQVEPGQQGGLGKMNWLEKIHCQQQGEQGQWAAGGRTGVAGWFGKTGSISALR